jgi:hypothetical protein
MKELWELAGKIGSEAERNDSYYAVYKALSKALDEAESHKLIEYKGD